MSLLMGTVHSGGGCGVREWGVYESSLYYFLPNSAVNPKLPLNISLLIKKIIDY